jgi:hypothetical protein
VPIPETNVEVELYMFDCGGEKIFQQREGYSAYVRCCAHCDQCCEHARTISARTSNRQAGRLSACFLLVASASPPMLRVRVGTGNPPQPCAVLLSSVE